MVKAVYPGTFDPPTNGHVDIATRAATFFDQLIVAVYDAPPKNLLFTTQERVALMKEALKHLPNVKVVAYTELTVDFAHKIGAKVLVRGLRMDTDFDMEFEMALMNKKLAPDLETICLMTNLEYQFISSSLLKEVARLGGEISCLVPEAVAQALMEKLELRQKVAKSSSREGGV